MEILSFPPKISNWSLKLFHFNSTILSRLNDGNESYLFHFSRFVKRGSHAKLF